MKSLLRIAALLVAVIALGQTNPAAAAPLYKLAGLPDLGFGSITRNATTVNDKLFAVGEVNTAMSFPRGAFWFRRGNVWKLHVLTDAGAGAEVAAVTPEGNGATFLVCGVVRFNNGNHTAALWRLIATGQGWADTLIPLGDNLTRTEARVILRVNPTVVGGCRTVAGVTEVSNAVIWSLDSMDTIHTTDLPGFGANFEELYGGAPVGNGNLRTVGCVKLSAGSPLEFSCEWIGNPDDGFMLSLLPPVYPSTVDQEVRAVDSHLCFAVGGGLNAGGAWDPIAWSTFPQTLGSWVPLELPTFPHPPGAHLIAVNTLGRAVGTTDEDGGSFTQRINVPSDQARAILFQGLVGNETLKEVDFLNDDRVAGGVFQPRSGAPHACLLLPTGTEVPDWVDGDPDPNSDRERALIRKDAFHLEINSPAEETADLNLAFDVSHSQDYSRLRLLGRLAGHNHQRIVEKVFLLDKDTDAETQVSSLGRKDSIEIWAVHRLPPDLSPYVTKQGTLRVRLRWDGTRTLPAGGVYQVQLNAANLAR